jgi:isoleucyl-tRNA synthetase
MDLALDVCNLGHAIRNSAAIKLRQPLRTAVIAADQTQLDHLDAMRTLMEEEMNVKKIELTPNREKLVDYHIKLRPQLGAKYGRLFPAIRTTLDAMNPHEIAHAVQKGSNVNLEVQGTKVVLAPDDVEVTSQPKAGYGMAEGDNLLVAIETTLTDDLRDEGVARDIVRRVQNQRKEAGFDIADEIILYYETGPRLAGVFTKHGAGIMSETLAKELVASKPPKESNVAEYSLQNENVKIGLVRCTKEAARK